MIKNKKYTEKPTLCNEVTYENGNLKLTKIWTWNVNSVYEEDDANVCKALLSGEYCNGGGKSTFVSYEGKRLIELEFDYICEYEDDMWLVRINDKDYGFLNKNIEIVVPLKYKFANDFKNGYASVHNGDEWLFVDKNGNEIFLENKYERIESYSDDLARVSTGSFLLAYYSDYDDYAGIWGYVDKTGKEVIKPQYIYAFDFLNDRAVVAKGKWTKDKKWDNKHNQGRYWTEEELWGVIDSNGKEIIPCIYDEIKQFMNDDYSICEDYYIVHAGGWKNGKWAILDRDGNQITEPIFEAMGYEYFNGVFTYYGEDTLGDTPSGIYDLNQNKVLFEPQFDNVTFLDDGNIRVEVFDEDLGYKIEKIIDKAGKELFKSDYSSIYTWEHPWLAIKEKGNSTIYNRIDKQGNILDGAEFFEKVSYWDSAINFENRTYIYSDNKKLGLKSFNGEILIPAKYEYFRNCHNDKQLYYFQIQKDDNKQGLMKSDGTVILAPKYYNIQVCKNNIIICNGENCVEVYKYEAK